AHRPDLRPARRHPLRRGQHPGRGPAHLHLRVEQRHAEIRGDPRRQGSEGSRRGAARAGRRHQRGRRRGVPPGCRLQPRQGLRRAAGGPGPTVKSGLPLRDAVEEYLASLRVEAGLSPHTIAAYRRDLTQYLEFLAGKEPTTREVDDFSAELVRRGLSDSTHKRKLSAVKGFHRFMVSEGLRDDDPPRLVTSPRRPDPFPKALDIDEAIALVEAPDRSTVGGRRDAALLEFLYATGARVSEAVALDLPDLDLEEGVAIVTGKGSKQRLVPIGSKAVEALRSWLPDRLALIKRATKGDPVFLNLRGGRLTRQGAFGGDAYGRGRSGPSDRPRDARSRYDQHDPGLHAGQSIPRNGDLRPITPQESLMSSDTAKAEELLRSERERLVRQLAELGAAED